MKKYLFLLFLVGIYIGLKNNYKTQPVSLSIDEKHINLYKIDFENGINSNKLTELLSDYNDIKIKKINDNSVSCADIKKCIEQIFYENDLSFEENHIISGFNIKSIEVISYKDKLMPFLNNNDFSFKIID